MREPLFLTTHYRQGQPVNAFTVSRAASFAPGWERSCGGDAEAAKNKTDTYAMCNHTLTLYHLSLYLPPPAGYSPLEHRSLVLLQ
jgi:hypothetical protein